MNEPEKTRIDFEFKIAQSHNDMKLELQSELDELYPSDHEI